MKDSNPWSFIGAVLMFILAIFIVNGVINENQEHSYPTDQYEGYR
jgi:hypothetical protein